MAEQWFLCALALFWLAAVCTLALFWLAAINTAVKAEKEAGHWLPPGKINSMGRGQGRESEACWWRWLGVDRLGGSHSPLPGFPSWNFPWWASQPSFYVSRLLTFKWFRALEDIWACSCSDDQSVPHSPPAGDHRTDIACPTQTRARVFALPLILSPRGYVFPVLGSIKSHSLHVVVNTWY